MSNEEVKGGNVYLECSEIREIIRALHGRMGRLQGQLKRAEKATVTEPKRPVEFIRKHIESIGNLIAYLEDQLPVEEGMDQWKSPFTG